MYKDFQNKNKNFIKNNHDDMSKINKKKINKNQKERKKKLVRRKTTI